MSRLPLLLLALLLAGAAARAEDFQGSSHKLEYDAPPIAYNDKTAAGPVAELQRKIDSGELKLRWDDRRGYLPALLEALQVPVSSQLLVFSKTSLQRKLISPSQPRALYFNDNVYIGYIPDAPLIEVSAVDPALGGVFFHLDQTAAAKPVLARDSDCMQCHGGGRSLGVPGHIVRSIGTDKSGEIDSQTEVTDISHCTPLADRWAGWYVTGTHGKQTHRGNLVGAAAFERQQKEPNVLGNLTELQSLVSLDNYPAATSDIVAHMVLEHQSHMHNYITRLHYETVLMMATYGHIRYLERQVDAFLRYLLFTEEAALNSPIKGSAQFAADFASQSARPDSKGRSLREFDLQTRLFKYPCSFLIYSEAFDQIPQPMKEHLYRRLWNILNGEDTGADFRKLAATDRTAIKEILLETKTGLPDYWHQPTRDGRIPDPATF